MRLALVLVLLAGPSAALANNVAVDVNVDVNVTTTDPAPLVLVLPRRPPPPEPGAILRGSRWEIGAFFEGGVFSASKIFSQNASSDVGGGQGGLRVEIARQFGALRLGVEGSFAKAAASYDVYKPDGWWDGWEDTGAEILRAGATARLRAGGFTDGAHRAEVVAFIEGGAGRERIIWDNGDVDQRTNIILGGGFEVAGGSDRVGGFEMNVRVTAAPSLLSYEQTHDLGILFGIGGRLGL